MRTNISRARALRDSRSVRKNSPLLLQEIAAFRKGHGPGSIFMNVVMKKYYNDISILKNVYSKEHQAKVESLIEYFRKYGKTHDFDYLMIAAQGFQESRLDQSVHSKMGAIGVMQMLLPRMAADPENRKQRDRCERGEKTSRHEPISALLGQCLPE